VREALFANPYQRIWGAGGEPPLPVHPVTLSSLLYFLERYARAREAQADKYFQEIIEIADAATPETVNVAQLRVDSRKFTVARLAPKKYGDHISHNGQRRRQQQLPTANPHSVQQRW
jgi:Bacteriophage Sf6, terminase small subunit-like